MDTIRNVVFMAVGFLFMLITPLAGADSGDSYIYPGDSYAYMYKKHQVVVTGAYRCPGDFPGFQHSITFTASELGDLNIETEFDNLDTGDCTPRGQDALNLAQDLGCTTGPLYAFKRNGSPGAAFGFVCKGKRDRIVSVIEKLSGEILRPAQ